MKIAGDSYLTQLAQYIGMVLVIFIIPLLLKHKKKDYTIVGAEEINMVKNDHHTYIINMPIHRDINM
jgi:hypothetical protein